MRLLIDANIVLDVLQKREAHWRDSSAIWKLCETEQAEGFLSALSFANLAYIMRRELSAEQVADVLGKLRLIFQFTDFGTVDLSKAVELRWNDLEDAIQAATAERIAADFIITRNVRDFMQSKVPALTPAEFLARL